ncbi:MAG: hypothetical protein H6Q28_693 [Bacteroidetes bacterium]|nr:hypothetical protein [Bacteroidota bacterium]
MTSSRPHIERILSALAARSFGESQSVTVRDVLAGEIPRGVRSYLVAEVARWLAEDLHSAPRFSRLNLDEEGMYHVQKSLLQSLAASYTLTRPELMAALRVAVEFTDNYLCRPQWTLEHFIFAEGERVSISTVRARLDHCADYAYFPTLLEGIFRRRGTAQVRREDFRHLLGQIDDHIVKQHNARELALLMKPIFDFLLLKDASPDDTIPLHPILVFFEDKKMRIMKEYLESICRLRGAEEISLANVTALIEELYRGETPKSPEPEVPTTAGLPDAAPVPTTEDAGATQPEPAGAQNAGDGDALPPGWDDSPRPSPEETAADPTPAGILEETPALPEISEFVSPKQRQRFIRRIFRKDEAYYGGVLATLNGMGSWEEAASYLQHIFDVNELDPYDRDVVAFTDAVQKRYSSAGEAAG